MNEYWLYMFKNNRSICYAFFAVDDVIVTSVNNYTSMMGISTEDKYLTKSLRENKTHGGKRLLKCFLTKTGVLVDWKRWSKKLKTQVLLFDVVGSGRPRVVRTLSVLTGGCSLPSSNWERKTNSSVQCVNLSLVNVSDLTASSSPLVTRCMLYHTE